MDYHTVERKSLMSHEPMSLLTRPIPEKLGQYFLPVVGAVATPLAAAVAASAVVAGVGAVVVAAAGGGAVAEGAAGVLVAVADEE